MPQGATGRFTDVEDYQTSLLDLTADLIVTQAGTFDAQLTWAKLPNLHLLCAQEALARVAYISLPAAAVHVSFATRPGPTLLWNGVELRRSEVLLHSPGELLHQRTTGPCHWGFLSITPLFFDRFGSAIAGHHVAPPTVGRLVRPQPGDLARLLRLHARVAHLVRTRPVTVAHPETGLAMEHELLHALVTCLTSGEARFPSHTTRRHAAIMVRFEAALANYPDRVLPMGELCALVDASDRTLRTCCIELLGIGPSSYMRLRRLKRVRAAISHADLASAKIGELARRFGFQEMGRFAAAYRAAFGETPSATMRRARNVPLKSGPSESA